MRRTLAVAAMLATLVSSLALKPCPAVASGNPAAAKASGAGPANRDISAGRRHARVASNRWQAVQPYPTYGFYGPRPYYYRPYPVFLTFPFGFNVGFDPYR